MPKPSAPPGTRAILFATAASDDGFPAAALRWEDGTLLSRLLAQLAGLGVNAVEVVTRPDFADRVRESLHGSTATLAVSETLSDDLRAVERYARASNGGGLVVGLADIVTQTGALAGLLADPRTSTGVLTTAAGLGRPYSFSIRNNRGRVVSAASAYHAVHKGLGRFLGVIRVAPANLPELADAAGRLAALTAGPLADGWEEQLDHKAGRWRMRLAAIAGGWEPDDGDAEPPAPDEIELDPGNEAELARRRAAAGEDATALLLVGLVRAGVHMGNSFVRKLYWARPLSDADVERARAEMSEYDEDRALLDSAVKASDGFFTTFFVSPYSKYIARWSAHRGFTPNQITTLSVLIGFAAAAAFATGERWGLVTGAILLQIAFTTDCVDGQLARYTRTFSKLGAWLDSIFDRTKEYAVFGGLAIGAASAGDPVWLLAAMALTLQTVRHAMDFSYAAAQHQVIGAVPQQPLEDPYDRPRRARALEPDEPDPEPDEEEEFEEAPGRKPLTPRRIAGLALRSWRRLDRLPGMLWVKRMVAFPIGERFAAISITAALFTPRTTFMLLLIWGTFAALYSTAGRLLRSVRSR
jgi:phosphatidylglycerophosphate synthase